MAANIRVQPDWMDTAPGESFWINLTPSPVDSSATIYANAKISMSESSISVDSDSVKASFIEHGASKRLSVSAFGQHWTFIGPTKIESSKKGRALEHLDVTSNGTLIARTHNDGTATVWSTTDDLVPGTARTYRSWRPLVGEHVGDIYFTRFFPSGKVALTGGADTTLRIWDLMEDWDGTAAAMIKGHKQAVFDADFVERGRNIISCSRDGVAKLWDVPSQACITEFSPSAGPLLSCRLGASHSPSSSVTGDQREVGTEGKVLGLAGDDGSVHLYDVRSREKIFSSLPHKNSTMTRVCFLPSSNIFVGGDSVGRLHFWDLRKLDQVRTLHRNTASVSSIVPMSSFSCVVSHGDGCTYVWDLNSMSSVAELSGPDYDPVYSVAVATDIKQIFTGARDGLLRCYAL